MHDFFSLAELYAVKAASLICLLIFLYDFIKWKLKH
jgi:hypothetical protein